MNNLHILTRCAALLGAVGLMSPHTAHAVVGDPDPSFGGGNGVIFINAALTASGHIALTPDGRIVMVSEYVGNGVSVYRYLSDGSPDTSFNAGSATPGQSTGILVAPPPPEASVLGWAARTQQVAVAGDGKITVLLKRVETPQAQPGTEDDRGFSLVRLNADGTRDSAFGDNGVATFRPDNMYLKATAVALAPDAGAVVGGECGSFGKACAVRMTASGQLDSGFGSGGLAQYEFLSRYSAGRADALALRADGSIVQTGSCYGTGSTSLEASLCVWQYGATGMPGQMLRWSIAGISQFGSTFGSAMAVSPTGAIVVAQQCLETASGNRPGCVARFKADPAVPGALAIDPSFSVNGSTAVTAPGYWVTPTSLLLQGDGRIVVVASCYKTGESYNAYCLYRLNHDGSPDASFGDAGSGRYLRRYSTGVGASDSAYRAALQADGKLVVGATCRNTALGTRGCIARHDLGEMANAACSLDIDGDGRVTGTVDALLHARVALGVSGDAVVAGIGFPANARRKTWPAIRDFLVSQCGLSLMP